MAHSQPLGAIENHADAARLTVATAALLEVLKIDERVRAHYHAWLRSTELEPWIERCRLFAIPENVIGFRDALLATTPDGVASFIHDIIGLDYEWLPALLLAEYRTGAYNEARGDRQTLALGVRPTLTLPRGKKAARGGADIRRNVEWFYRAHVAEPRISIHALAAEYAAVTGRNTDARSVVQNGIKQARQLLSLNELKK